MNDEEYLRLMGETPKPSGDQERLDLLAEMLAAGVTVPPEWGKTVPLPIAGADSPLPPAEGSAGELPPKDLQMDIASIVIRCRQIHTEDEPTHWLWDRVMTCDVPRLTRYLDAETVSQVEDVLGGIERGRE